MTRVFLVNIILDRLPMSIFGITYVNLNFTGQVYAKLNIVLNRNELALP